jgi:CRISPR-associated protein Cmr4
MANNRIYWLHALTPVHAGVGRGVGYIDLPIDRDAVTTWPLIRGSAFKGVWSDYYGATGAKRKEKEGEEFKYPHLRAAFGASSDGDNNSNSGSLIPTDARLVCLPVRSFRGTFAWCTSSLALRFLHRMLALAGMKELPKVPDPSPEATDTTRGEAHLADAVGLVENGGVYLEDLDFKAVHKPEVGAWATAIAAWAFPDDGDWQIEFKKRFVVLPDVVFDFLCETGTEVNTRVRINDDTKTVETGALWTEESLPAETILAGVIACDRVFGKDGKDITPSGLLDSFATKALSLQIGGKATVGRGQVRCVFTNPNGGGQ